MWVLLRAPGRCRLAGWLTVIGLLFSFSVPAYAGPLRYSFTNIAETGGGFVAFDSPPTINAAGVVAFQARTARPGGGMDSGIFVGAGGPDPSKPGPVTTVASTTANPPFPNTSFQSFGRPDINRAGIVAFRATFTTGDGIFTGVGGPVTAVATNDPQFIGFFGNPSINDSSQVVFNVSQPGNFSAVFRHTPTPGTPFTGLTRVAITGETFEGFGNNPAINNVGTVAFKAVLTPQTEAIFAAPIGMDATLLPGSVFSLVSDPDLNDLGQVGYIATNFEEAATAVFVEDSILGQMIIADTFLFTGLGASLSNRGSIAFATDSELFLVKADRNGNFPMVSVRDKVLAAGDPLFGSTVFNITPFDFGPGALNDAGQLTAIVALNDGRLVVVRANPVPEPGALIIWLSAVSTFGLSYLGRSPFALGGAKVFVCGMARLMTQKCGSYRCLLPVFPGSVLLQWHLHSASNV